MNGQIPRCKVPLKRFLNYETGLVALLFLTWGTVFLDRMSLVYLAPFIVPELHLTHAQVGLLVSALALAWGVIEFNLWNCFGPRGPATRSDPFRFYFFRAVMGLWNRADVRATLPGAVGDGPGGGSNVVHDHGDD
jgi:hypothetical protein